MGGEKKGRAGNYVKVRTLGKGSFGEAILVKNVVEQKTYVLKRINLTHASKKERQAAIQEAHLLERLVHPNIVEYKEAWMENCRNGMKILCIVMGYCSRGDIYTLLEEKRKKGEKLDEDEIMAYFVQILSALAFMHKKKCLHRDLKTQNLFFNQE
eukprot:Rmarinus@m.6940